MLAQAVLWTLAASVASGAGGPAVRPVEDEAPLRIVDQSRYRVACPDYSHYSKYALQYVLKKCNHTCSLVDRFVVDLSVKVPWGCPSNDPHHIAERLCRR